MGSYVSKFGFYEFLALLLPGTLFTQTFLLFSVFWRTIMEGIVFQTLSKEQYAVIIVLGLFLVGLILQELGTLSDRFFCYCLLYGENPDQAWERECPVSECKCQRWVIRDPRLVDKAKKLCERVYTDEDISPNRYFYYMLNTLEAEGIAGKAEK